MKVLKKGTERKDLAKKFTCGECGALLEVHPGDIRESSGMDISGCYDTSYWFTCPECGHTTGVSRWWLKY